MKKRLLIIHIYEPEIMLSKILFGYSEDSVGTPLIQDKRQRMWCEHWYVCWSIQQCVWQYSNAVKNDEVSICNDDGIEFLLSHEREK